MTLEVVSFQNVSGAVTALTPFLTGKGFPGGATQAITIPTQSQIKTIVGKNTSS